MVVGGPRRRRRRGSGHRRCGRGARDLPPGEDLYLPGHRGDLRSAGRRDPSVHHRRPPASSGVVMAFPYYVNPEQMTQDKAEFARKGIARGKSLVTLEYDGRNPPARREPVQALEARRDLRPHRLRRCGQVQRVRSPAEDGHPVGRCGGLPLQPRRRPRQGPGQHSTPRPSGRSSIARSNPSRWRSWWRRWGIPSSRVTRRMPSTRWASTEPSRTRPDSA